MSSNKEHTLSKIENFDLWIPIMRRIEAIGDYYGIELSYEYIKEMTQMLAQGLLSHSAFGHLPSMVFAKCVDGTIKQGYLDGNLDIKLLESRQLYEDEKIDRGGYAKILLKSDEVFVYCNDDKTLYGGISPLVGRYIMRHNLSKTIIDIVKGKYQVSENIFTDGNMIKIFERFIKQERVLNKKKDLFREELEKEFTSYTIDGKLFPMYYISKKLHIEDEKKMVTLGESDIPITIDREQCKKDNISIYELAQRIATGLSITEAYDKCEYERDKYKLSFNSINGHIVYREGNLELYLPETNYNFIRYIEHVARQEELGLEV